MNEQQAQELFHRSICEASGYFELTELCKFLGGDIEPLKKHCIQALQRFSDNDDAIDALQITNSEDYLRKIQKASERVKNLKGRR